MSNTVNAPKQTELLDGEIAKLRGQLVEMEQRRKQLESDITEQWGKDTSGAELEAAQITIRLGAGQRALENLEAKRREAAKVEKMGELQRAYVIECDEVKRFESAAAKVMKAFERLIVEIRAFEEIETSLGEAHSLTTQRHLEVRSHGFSETEVRQLAPAEGGQGNEIVPNNFWAVINFCNSITEE